jgi:type II secretory pathway pseudopilin PulG
MNWVRRAAMRARRNDASGFTLVEMVVAAALGMLLTGMVLSTILVANRSVSSTQAVSDLNGEATELLNRLAGDLRQAAPVRDGTAVTPAIVGAQNPFPAGNPQQVTSITFDADFNGDGCIAGVVSDGCDPAKAVDPYDPETESFCWDPVSQLVYLVAGGVVAGSCTPSSGGSAKPLLSGKVSSLQISYDSSSYLYDANADGITTWQELDAAPPPVGNGNDVLDLPELNRIDSVQIALTVSESGHAQTYQTLVSLRNVS